MEDVQNIGGTPGMIKFLIDNGLFDGDQMTGKYVCCFFVTTSANESMY